MKFWLLLGLEIDMEDPKSRATHIKIDMRSLRPMFLGVRHDIPSEAELDRRMQDIMDGMDAEGPG